MTTPPALRVLTRNLYVGGDLVALAGATGPADLAARVAGFLASVTRSRFDVRARLLAAEIGAAAPDVVGVQEAALWRSGPPDGPAEEVTADWLQLLTAALEAAGHPYDVVVSGEAADLTVPGPGGLVRLTMRDALLVRRGRGIEVSATATGRFLARTERVLGGVRFAVDRGWVLATLRTRVGRVEVVATHLDSIDADVAAAQADEVLGVLAAGSAVVLLDANAGPPPADPEPWQHLLDGGLVDAWVAVHPDDPGHTFGLGPGVDDPDWSGLVARLDHVLVRGLAVHDVARTGTERRDPGTGLWASDHAGVLAVLGDGRG